GMKVSIELLLENARYLSGAELNELLNSLHLSVSSLQNLIDNLLESSKIEANHFSLRRQPIQIAHTVSEALRLIQPFLNRRHQHITLDQPFVLPTISADATRLTQVLVNLLANASKYSPMNSIIDITLDIRSNGLYVAIADRGQGIPEEQRESVFRQFVRLNREAKSDYSAGLGLAVVKAIVEAHSGQIGVDNRDGGGAIFWFMLPTEGDVLYESAGR
ncbi:MAG: ATP-binding protein, partial [Chloroflexi bacterium]|nr:ATP-binding protein [Chloroflexota bacterium]